MFDSMGTDASFPCQEATAAIASTEGLRAARRLARGRIFRGRAGGRRFAVLRVVCVQIVVELESLKKTRLCTPP